jgi:hypothetical protein
VSDTRDAPSVIERTRPVAAGAAVVGAHFLKKVPAFVLGEEAVLLAPEGAAERRVAVHDGGVLASAGDGTRILTGGDDGKVVALDAAGKTNVVGQDAKHRWIDHVALGPDGAVAWSAGKNAFVRIGTGEPRSIELPSTPGGLAFAPKGVRLAIAHYNGASLWFPRPRPRPSGSNGRARTLP